MCAPWGGREEGAGAYDREGRKPRGEGSPRGRITALKTPDHASKRVIMGYSLILSTPSMALKVLLMVWPISLKLVPFMSSTMLNMPSV